MSVAAGCTVECTRTPDCGVCGRQKKLAGRDYAAAMGGGYCDHECPGYRENPKPGHLWWSEWQAHIDGDHSGCMDCGAAQSNQERGE